MVYFMKLKRELMKLNSWILEMKMWNCKFLKLKSWIHEFKIVNSRKWNREFIKLKSQIREAEFMKLKSLNRGFMMLKSRFREVKFVNSWSWNLEFINLKCHRRSLVTYLFYRLKILLTLSKKHIIKERNKINTKERKKKKQINNHIHKKHLEFERLRLHTVKRHSVDTVNTRLIIINCNRFANFVKMSMSITLLRVQYLTSSYVV